jgi:hypothetical protein
MNNIEGSFFQPLTDKKRAFLYYISTGPYTGIILLLPVAKPGTVIAVLPTP